MHKFSIRTSKPKEIIDITDQVNDWLRSINANKGLCNIFVAHTTCCLATADLDPGTDKDLLDAIEKMFPQGNYRHPHDPSHVGEHIMSSLVGPSINIPVKNGELILGPWQRVVLVELSGPRTRNLVVSFSKND